METQLPQKSEEFNIIFLYLLLQSGTNQWLAALDGESNLGPGPIDLTWIYTAVLLNSVDWNTPVYMPLNVWSDNTHTGLEGY